MDIIHVILLSLIEGITEFLPISSTGHLILASQLLSLPSTDFLSTFQISIQVGAVLAVLGLYAKKLLTNPTLIIKAFIGLFPTAIVGVFAYPIIKNYLLDSTLVVAISLILGGILIIIMEKYLFKDKSKDENLESITYKQALFTGLTQSIAVIPGVSRAASSIFGGMISGLNRKTATEFSFILALPTIMAASGYDLLKTAPSFTQNEILYLILGIILSFIFALISIKWLIKYVSSHNFTNFGWYRIIIGIIFLFIALN